MKNTNNMWRHCRWVVGTGLAVSGLVLAPFATSVTQAAAPPRAAAFQQAAQEFQVPAGLLMALSYNQSRWESHAGQQSIDGGYGLMNLTAAPPADNNKGDASLNTPAKPKQEYTLDKAAQLTKTKPADLERSDSANIRGGAAVLADYAKAANGGKLPGSSDWAAWYAAVAVYGGATNSATAQGYADDVFATWRHGEARTTMDNQQLQLPADTAVQSDHSKLATLKLADAGRGSASTPKAECPAGLDCRFIPAAYAQTDPKDPSVYGNYDPANRPKDMNIKYIVIHDTEGSYDSAIKAFQDPAYQISTQYVIRSSDGQITQMVKNSDVAFGAGDFYTNMHGINIEHEGQAASGAAWYSEAMYQSSAKLVKYLAAKYNIPLDRDHIIGHDNVSATTAAGLKAQHYDPGAYWDWNHYMALLHDQTDAQYTASLGSTAAPAVGKTVTLAPNFKTYQQTFSYCGEDGTMPCAPLPKQSSSAVPIRTQPSSGAPFVSDPYVHSNGAAGTDQLSDWGASLSSGQRFVVTGRQGDWTGVSVGGQTGWFYDPMGANRVSRTSPSAMAAQVSAKAAAGLKVYGVAYPETSVYPAQVPPPAMDVLYTIPKSMALAATTTPLQTDYFYDATFDYSKPYDHVIFRGKTKYYQVQVNHRIGYVKADEAQLK